VSIWSDSVGAVLSQLAACVTLSGVFTVTTSVAPVTSWRRDSVVLDVVPSNCHAHLAASLPRHMLTSWKTCVVVDDIADTAETLCVAADKLKTVLTYLEGREHDVSASLAKIDAEEKKREAELKTITASTPPVKDNKDPLAKSQGILKMLMKKEHRKFQKEKATLKSELQEVQHAVTSIKKGDVAGLTKVMSHMQGEMKSLEAKSHKFLY